MQRLSLDASANLQRREQSLDILVLRPLAVGGLVIAAVVFVLRRIFLAAPANVVLTNVVDVAVLAFFFWAVCAAFLRQPMRAFAATIAGSMVSVTAIPHVVGNNHQAALCFAGVILCVAGLHPEPRPLRFPLLVGIPSVALVLLSALALSETSVLDVLFFTGNAAVGLGVAAVVALGRRWVSADADAAKAQLLASDRMASIGVISAGLSHEINNPLAYIQMNLAAVMGSESLTLEERDAIADAVEGATRIEKVVKNLGFFSRPERALAIVDIEPVLRNTTELVRPQVRHLGEVTLEVEGFLYIEDASGRLGQIILNLLTNAVQSLTATTRAHIAVTARADGEEVVIRVEDNGPGVAPDIAERVFDSFFTTKKVGEGTGLGLSICRHLARTAGGTIRLTDDGALGGACFELRLPRRYPSGPALRTSAPSVGDRRARALIIDDDDRVCRAVARSLRQGCEVDIASSGDVALRMLPESNYDIVLCDAMMPGLSGLDVYNTVAQRWPEMAERFVFITGGAYAGISEDDLYATGRPVLRKPVKPARLRQMVADAADGVVRPDAA